MALCLALRLIWLTVKCKAPSSVTVLGLAVVLNRKPYHTLNWLSFGNALHQGIKLRAVSISTSGMTLSLAAPRVISRRIHRDSYLAGQEVQSLVRNVVTQAPGLLMLSTVKGQVSQDTRYVVFRLCILDFLTLPLIFSTRHESEWYLFHNLKTFLRVFTDDKRITKQHQTTFLSLIFAIYFFSILGVII